MFVHTDGVINEIFLKYRIIYENQVVVIGHDVR